MKNSIILFVFLIVNVFTIKSQSYTGYFNDNYAGVQSVIYNPASIVDSRFKTDVNLFSISATGENDYYGVSISDLFTRGYSLEKEAKTFPSKDNNFVGNVDIMLPSFMMNIAPKHSIALYTRARVVSNFLELNGDLVNKILNDFDTSDSFNLQEGDFNIQENSWAELGASYATILINKKQHFLKGGVTVKYLQGVANTYINGRNLSVDYIQNDPDILILNELVSTGQISIGGNIDFTSQSSDFEFSQGSNGVGFDFGFQYEWRPDYEKYDLDNQDGKTFKNVNKYKLRAGVSITDLGSIKYKGATQNVFDVNMTVNEEDFSSADGISNLLENYYTKINTSIGVKFKLPTMLHLNFDYNIINKFYLNLNSDLSLVSKATVNSSLLSNAVNLTPRYESKWFSAYVPVSWMEISGFQMGTGIRIGSLFFGSGSVVTNLFSKESKSIDVHVGLKVPIYQGK